MDAAHQASLSTISWSSLKLMSIELVMPSNHPLLSHSPLAFNLSQIRVFSSELALCLRWPEYCSFSFSISSSNEYSGLIFFRIDWLDILVSKGLSRVFSNTAVQKQQFFSTQPSLWSTSHIYAWLLEKPQLSLYEPLSANTVC